MSIGVPIKMLHEAEGHIVTLESGTGETYRGKLIEAEDNMNCQLASVTVTARDGKSSQVEHVYIRGSNIKFVIIPDMLKNAPMFKNVDKSQRGAGEQAMKTRILRERIGRGRGSGNPQRGGWSGGRGNH